MSIFSKLKEEQLLLSKMVSLVPLGKKVFTAAGIDVAFDMSRGSGFCVIVVIDSTFEVVEVVNHIDRVDFPYIPGFLSFRELPIIEKAFEKLTTKPDLYFVDGQGVAHPRGLGIASHFGVKYNIPVIGCAKKLLVGTYDEPDIKKGSYSIISYKGAFVGAAVRTKDDVKPVFVSPGHLITLPEAIKYTLMFTTNYRVPEPTRLADILSKKAKRGEYDIDLLVQKRSKNRG